MGAGDAPPVPGSLMEVARRVRMRMREHEAALGVFFPPQVQLEVALDAIEAGIAAHRLLDVAVGYLMLKEVLSSSRPGPEAPDR